MTLYTTIEVDEQEIEVAVDFHYEPGEPMSRDMEYGGCAPSIEFDSEFTDTDKNVHYPTGPEMDRIIDECHDMVADMNEERELSRYGL